MPTVVTRTTQKTPATSSDMEPGIWSRLPADILERILALLPLKAFLNLRSTCKHFNSLIFSPSFLSQQNSPQKTIFSFLLLSHPQFHNYFPLYDSTLGRWRKLTLPLSCAPANLISASNGLLFFTIPNYSSFVVCNLLTRSTKTIEFPNHALNSASLISSPSSNSPHGYKIFVLSSSPSLSSSAFVYDSAVRQWTRYTGFNPDPVLSENSHQEGVFCKGSLYFTTQEPFSVVGFDMETGRWERSMAELPQDLAFVRLVSNGGDEGKVYLVGGIGRDGITRSLKVWELGENGSVWIEIGNLPELMCRKFVSICYHNYEHVYCFWHQGLVCVCCYTWAEILIYKFSRQRWHWLPKCPFLPEKWSCGFRWFSFVPDLYALV